MNKKRPTVILSEDGKYITVKHPLWQDDVFELLTAPDG